MRIADDVWCLQARRWQTNSVVAVREGSALVSDPSWTPAEIAALRGLALSAGGRDLHVVVTHADVDHVCGIGSFPGARVLAGPATACALADGTAAARVAAARCEWGLTWPGSPRVDRVVATGPCVAGPFRLEAVEAAGHADDGTAWLLVDEGILVPGDYLCSVCPPLVLASVRGFRATVARLLDVVEGGRARTMVPGHGPVLSAHEAAALARADLLYLDAVLAAAAEAAARGLPPGEALVHVWSAACPPRAAVPDFAVYDPHTTTARAAVADLLTPW